MNYQSLTQLSYFAKSKKTIKYELGDIKALDIVELLQVIFYRIFDVRQSVSSTVIFSIDESINFIQKYLNINAL